MQEKGGPGDEIVVVGPCAAGKTTLVQNLHPRGFPIRACAQEHSTAPQLWRRRSRPRVLIYLDAELETISARQNRRDWTQDRLDQQRQRLKNARLHCDLYLRTDDLSREQVAGTVSSFLIGRGIVPNRARPRGGRS